MAALPRPSRWAEHAKLVSAPRPVDLGRRRLATPFISRPGLIRAGRASSFASIERRTARSGGGSSAQRVPGASRGSDDVMKVLPPRGRARARVDAVLFSMIRRPDAAASLRGDRGSGNAMQCPLRRSLAPVQGISRVGAGSRGSRCLRSTRADRRSLAPPCRYHPLQAASSSMRSPRFAASLAWRGQEGDHSSRCGKIDCSAWPFSGASTSPSRSARSTERSRSPFASASQPEPWPGSDKTVKRGTVSFRIEQIDCSLAADAGQAPARWPRRWVICASQRVEPWGGELARLLKKPVNDLRAGDLAHAFVDRCHEGAARLSAGGRLALASGGEPLGRRAPVLVLVLMQFFAGSMRSPRFAASLDARTKRSGGPCPVLADRQDRLLKLLCRVARREAPEAPEGMKRSVLPVGQRHAMSCGDARDDRRHWSG